MPFSENFPAHKSGFDGEMYNITQSEQGFMLFGNQHGIVSFNARHWESYNWKGRVHFFKNSDERVFVGGFNSLAEITFLNNAFQLNYIIDTTKYVGQITQITEHRKRLFFTTSAHELFYVENNIAHKILQKNSEINLFEFNNTLYISTSNEFFEYKESEVSETFMSNFFANKQVQAMFLFNNNCLVAPIIISTKLILTRKKLKFLPPK